MSWYAFPRPEFGYTACVRAPQHRSGFRSGREPALTLWRALRSDVPSEGPLHPDFYPREIRAGKFRPADVTVETVSGVEYVVPVVYRKRPEEIWRAQGTSLFDRPNTFVGNLWYYFEIPAGKAKRA